MGGAAASFWWRYARKRSASRRSSAIGKIWWRKNDAAASPEGTEFPRSLPSVRTTIANAVKNRGEKKHQKVGPEVTSSGLSKRKRRKSIYKYIFTCTIEVARSRSSKIFFCPLPM